MVYMISNLIGDAIGSTVSAYAWSRWHWSGVSLTGIIMLTIAFITWGYCRLKSTAYSH